MSGSDIFLAVRDIWKTYAVPHGGGSRPVLRGLDFCLERGEMAGLVGESGSGKSTLPVCCWGWSGPTVVSCCWKVSPCGNGGPGAGGSPWSFRTM